MENYRHGDVLIRKVSNKKHDMKLDESNILVEGEVTGHAHRVDNAKVYKTLGTKENNYLNGIMEIAEKAALTHEEHKTIVFVPGTYKFYQQREYDEQEERVVID